MSRDKITERATVPHWVHSMHL
ncbi:protein of unknown function [Pararobbsia alpina]